MNKKEIFLAIAAKLKEKVTLLSESARDSHNAATDPENIARSKYETNGLSFSYLAEAQAELSHQAAQNLMNFESMSLKDFSIAGNCQPGALALIEINGNLQYLFMAICAGGTEVTVDGVTIKVITPESPLGSKLINASVGSFFELPNGDDGTLLKLL